MNNIATKQFTHDGFVFDILVEMNTKVERHPGGSRYHTVTIKSEGCYYEKNEVHDADLERAIKEEEAKAIAYVDSLGKELPIDERLAKMGFN